jgi:hypothetical protein
MIKSTKNARFIFKSIAFTLLIFIASPLYAGAKFSVTLEQAADQVRKSSNGRILSARTTKFKGQFSHRIQVLTPSGRVKIVQIPAALIKLEGYNDSNNYRNNSKQRQPDDNIKDNKRPNRYQNNNRQNTQPQNIKPNYQRPIQPTVKKEKSGNKK